MVKKMCHGFLAVLIVCNTIQVPPAYSQKYKAQGQIDPNQVRKVVTDLGIGEKVKVQLDSAARLNGKIQKIAENSFTIVETKTGEPKVVAFGEIRELQKKKFPTWAKVVIGVGGVIGLQIALMLAECGSSGCH